MFKWSKKTVNLALQGGGSHGAFTWGVLDRLLQEKALRFEGVSATSAGAMNAVCLAHGLATGGREGARETLNRFWHRVADEVPFNGTLHKWVNTADTGAPTPLFRAVLGLMRVLSPYQLNPLDINPLREIVTELFDFERIRRYSGLKLFIAATEVKSGRLKLFKNHELSADALLASACLPALHHAIEIDGVTYWDGGYSANPAISPLLYHCRSRDILIVLLSPLNRQEVPKSTDEIWRRVTELGFSAHFMREMRSLWYAQEYLRGSRAWLSGVGRRLRGMRFHMIQAEELMTSLHVDSKLNVHREFLEALCERGRERADQWLAAHAGKLKRRSSVDLRELFA